MNSTLPDRNIPPRPALSPEAYFAAPPAEDGVFELALVLGGTVSAGTFTAGVLDFLFQALDEWDKARAANLPEVAQHKVRIRIITGASGGGINAVLAARALNYSFPHAAYSDTAVWKRPHSSNPFYEVWVNQISIEALLSTSDLDKDSSGNQPPLVSILNGNVLTEVAERTLGREATIKDGKVVTSALSGFPTSDQPGVSRVPARSWVCNPLAIVVTHTNLSGVPYSQLFTSASSDAAAEYFTNHADYVRLYVGYSGLTNSASPGIRYMPDAKFVNVPDNNPVAVPTGLSTTPWSALAQNVLGTSAFPLGFPARPVARDGSNYAYRFAWNSLVGRYDWITPMWTKVSQPGQLGSYAFLSLDGGCTDNEPIMLASQVLEGLERAPHHANPANSVEANRAIVLVDPLCDPLPQAIPVGESSPPLISLLSPTLQMFIRSNRFATADIAGFLSNEVYNRFLVAPKRTDPETKVTVSGGEALCAEGMGAFMGFLCREFRHHDFMLGRRNCQAFLSGTFTLAPENPLFQGNAPEFEDKFGAGFPRPENGERAIIPLYGEAAKPQEQAIWPVGVFDADAKPEPEGGQGTDPKSVRDLLEMRIQAMLERVGTYLGLSFVARGAAAIFDHEVIGPAVTRKILEYVSSELGRKGLLKR